MNKRVKIHLLKSRSYQTSAFFIDRTYIALLIILLFINLGCGVSKKIADDVMHLTYIDDIVISEASDSLHFGGISGIDMHNDTLFMLSDSGKLPRIFFSELTTDDNNIKLSSPQIYLDIKTPKGKYFDLESIRYLNKEEAFLISSEGNIKKNIETSIFKMDKEGKIVNEYQLPEDYQIKNNRSKVIHNRAIEATTLNKDNTGFWFSTEFPLRSEGKPPKLFRSGANQQFLFYDIKKDKISRQFNYQLDPIPKIPLLPYSLNGLTGMLMIDPDKMITLERGFSAGWGKHSNRVKLFLIKSDKDLSKADQNSIKKYLLLDLKKIKKYLKADRIDNLEGICFGPSLADGSVTILLISDDNFDAHNDQLSQIIWLKIH